MTADGAVDPPASRCDAGRSVEAHFRGSTTPASERRMRQHLATCGACRQLYDRHLHLAAVDPGAAISARQRLANGLGLRLPAARAHERAGWLNTAIPVAVFGLCAIVGLGLFRHREADPQVRGGAATASSQLLVYEVAKQGGVRQATSQIDRRSGLAFAYVNVARKHRLLVFGVDDERRVYWYHPAWMDARDNPTGVAIVADDGVHELPQAVTHHLAGRRLQVFGAFADETLSVRDVETAVARAPMDDRGRLRVSLPDAEITRLDIALSGAP